MRKYKAGSTAKSPIPHLGSATVPGPASVCDPWGEQIRKACQTGLCVQRIYQDQVAEHQFTGSYHAVRRFLADGTEPLWSCHSGA